MSTTSNGSPRATPRPPSPPPPEVDWTVAAHELSKLLIPIDRQTKSCKPEELASEATKARRERQSLSASNSGSEPPEAAPRMALRVRKPAKPSFETVEEDETKKPAAKTSRRKTVAGAAVIAAEKAIVRSTTPKPEPSYTQPTSQSSRRLSTASNSGSVISDGASSRPNGHNRILSNGTSAISARPSTSQSVRPDSSMSSRGHSIPPVVVKKTRAPSQPRTDPSRTSRVRRKSPLNEATEQPQEQFPPILPPSRSSSVALPTTEDGRQGAQNSDIDSLTSGMKKIKLNLTTKAQREAKDQTKTASKVTAAKAPNKATASKPKPLVTEKPASLSDDSPSALQGDNHASSSAAEPNSLSTQVPHTPSSPQSTFPAYVQAHSQVATQVPLPPSSPAAPDCTQPTTREPSATPDVFIPYQPQGATPKAIVQQGELQWLSPNTATPSPMKRSDLPIFTATSVIPFGIRHDENQAATSNVKSEPVESPKKHDDSIWEVPETPQKK